jgi:hypothetical protein
MLRTTFHNRPAVQLENELIRVTVLADGGHIAEILDKTTGVNPLWIPPWVSAGDEDSTDFGDNSESRLLRGIMGHNLCLDLFGPPSDTEAAAGVVAHGEAGIVRYEFEGDLICRCLLPSSRLAFERAIRLEGRRVLIGETVENLSVFDRPIAWTQHVTLGPPFLERGRTQFRAPVARSQGIGDSEPQELETYTNAASSAGYTAHLMDPESEKAWFAAWSPSQLAIGYVWNRSDFPWMGVWDENHSRTYPPWNGRTLTRGMEFGVSPFPETRRQMIERGSMFGTPCCLWLDAKGRRSAHYYAVVGLAERVPATSLELAAL